MRALIVAIGLLSLTYAEAAPCHFRGAPFIETASGARSVDLRLGEEVRVFAAVPALIGERAVILSDSGAPTRVPLSACREVHVAWQRIEPLMLHTHTPSPNAEMPIYANAVVFGPRHGTWIGFDRIEQVSTPLAAHDAPLILSDARPSPAVGAIDRGARDRLGVMRIAATVSLDGESRTTATDLEHAFRYTVRDGNDFLGWLSTFFNVPYLFGSAGKGARAQAEQYYGADCADVLVAALRRAGMHIDYTSVGGLVEQMKRAAGPVEIQPCTDEVTSECGPSSLRWGTDVRPGDLLALDYVGAEELPRPWDHIVAVVEDRGPDGAPDGLLGPEDLVADSGDRAGLKLAELAQQGHVRVLVLRPPPIAKPKR